MQEGNSSQNRPEPRETKPKNGDSRWKEFMSTLGIIILAPIVALFLTTFVFQSYQVDGPSMETTLQDKDRLIVNKLGKTWSKITNDTFVPSRYEIVVFSHSGEFGGQRVTEKQLIKRVIGLPGDRVVIENGVVTIYNDENPNGFLVDEQAPTEYLTSRSNDNVDVTVDAGEVYVMGDNRSNSLDSRAFGTIRSQDIIGTLVLRIYPFDNIDTY